MGEREAQVSQPGTGRAEWGWREDPKVKSKPEAGHKGPRGFDDTRLPPTGPILAGPCLPVAVSTSEPWRGQAQGDVRGGCAQGVPLAPPAAPATLRTHPASSRGPCLLLVPQIYLISFRFVFKSALCTRACTLKLQPLSPL